MHSRVGTPISITSTGNLDCISYTWTSRSIQFQRLGAEKVLLLLQRSYVAVPVCVKGMALSARRPYWNTRSRNP